MSIFIDFTSVLVLTHIIWCIKHYIRNSSWLGKLQTGRQSFCSTKRVFLLKNLTLDILFWSFWIAMQVSVCVLFSLVLLSCIVHYIFQLHICIGHRNNRYLLFLWYRCILWRVMRECQHWLSTLAKHLIYSGVIHGIEIW